MLQNSSNNSILAQSLKPVYLLVLLLFFFNTFLLPHGLSLNFFLTPVFLWFILQDKKSIRLLIFLIVLLAIFAVIHWRNGVQPGSFMKSHILAVAAVVSFVVAYQYFRKYGERLPDHLKQITLYNFVFFLLAILLLAIPFLNSLVWSQVSMGHNVGGVARLQLFSPEPSHYALLLSPLLIYYVLSYLWSDHKKTYLLTTLLVAFPFLFSFSFGNFLVFALSIGLTILFFARKVLFRKDNLTVFILLGALIFLGFVLLLVVWPDHFFYKRLMNVVSGTDTSANGRTFQSFGLAWHLAKLKSAYWGIGLGQIKELGGTYYRDFFPYISTIPDPVRIPNSNAEMLASFGVIGLTLKVGVTLFLFFVQRLYRNAYSTALFIFIFVFQFMGSYLINFTELVIWALVFANPFQKFNR